MKLPTLTPDTNQQQQPSLEDEERLQAFGDSLSSKKDETVAAKVTIEDRWL